jgi:hypothetical protein
MVAHLVKREERASKEGDVVIDEKENGNSFLDHVRLAFMWVLAYITLHNRPI